MTPEPPSELRRRIVLAAAAAGATALGAWVASRQEAPPDAAAPTGLDPAIEAWWRQSFDTPAGGSIAMASLRGKPLLVNFWATWCAPCVREMPEIDRFYKDHAAKSWQVLGLAIDGPTPVREFLAKLPVSFPIGLAGLEGTDLARQLGNDRGGLPFSLAFDSKGSVAQRKLGETSYDELWSWARTVV